MNSDGRTAAQVNSDRVTIVQQWEYTWVVVPNNLGKVKVDGQKVPVHDRVNAMGEVGWELVAVEQRLPGTALSDFVLFFKRPR